jgi:hypothetical protein
MRDRQPDSLRSAQNLPFRGWSAIPRIDTIDYAFCRPEQGMCGALERGITASPRMYNLKPPASGKQSEGPNAKLPARHPTLEVHDVTNINRPSALELGQIIQPPHFSYPRQQAVGWVQRSGTHHFFQKNPQAS